MTKVPPLFVGSKFPQTDSVSCTESVDECCSDWSSITGVVSLV